LNADLGVCNEQVFGDVDTHQKIHLDELHVLDGLEEERA
jgi:hypothetical protein